MIIPIEHQIIEKDGQPLFVLVPYEEYLATLEDDLAITIPHDVVGRYIMQGQSLIRAWREFKGLTQEEVAEQMGISQSAYSQMEKPDASLRHATIQKIADALGVLPGQLSI